MSEETSTKPHAPGPWKLGKRGFTEGPKGTRTRVHDAASRQVASVIGDSLEICEANARLIASAPAQAERIARLEEALRRCEKVLGILPCEECEHSLDLHFDRYGCEYERGDTPGGEGEQGPYGEQAMGPCGCKAENLSDDGNDAFLLLRDIRQMRILREAQGVLETGCKEAK